jgi:hypothetical protein
MQTCRCRYSIHGLSRWAVIDVVMALTGDSGGALGLAASMLGLRA